MRQQRIIDCFCRLVDAEDFRNGWASDIRIQNSCVIAQPLGLNGEQAGNQRFSDPAFSANNRNDILDTAGVFFHSLFVFQILCAAIAIAATGIALMIACFSHVAILLFVVCWGSRQKF